jgi:hypothetical protein
LANVADLIETAVATLADSILKVSGAVIMNSPAQKATAIAAIEQNKGLSDNEFDDAVDLMMSNSNVANMYLAIGKDSSYTCFLQSQLDKLYNVSL